MNSRSLITAEKLNRDCDCSMTDLAALRREVDRVNGSGAILETHPYLFSEAPVFLEQAHADAMRRVIEAVERVAHLPAYQRMALAHAPAIAHVDQGTAGAFMGFDFHIAADGPKLIEINTNAGGAFLNAVAAGAARSCCPPADKLLGNRPSLAELESEILSMFGSEWAAAGSSGGLRTIAIIDDAPREQFLYPEFRLAQALFEARGISAHIGDPRELTIEDGRLMLRGHAVDLVYNRLTDFYFERAENETMRAAYEQRLAVITPGPRAHSLYADKRNLAILSDESELRRVDADGGDIEVLACGVPRTQQVTGCGHDWWGDRKRWFFKPRTGFGSRGAYRGDKLTRRVFAELVSREYMAQEFTPPSERLRSSPEGKQAFKVDIRCYAYRGQVQQMAARLYQGQTTNFRTAGGGFAPVYVVGEAG